MRSEAVEVQQDYVTIFSQRHSNSFSIKSPPLDSCVISRVIDLSSYFLLIILLIHRLKAIGFTSRRVFFPGNLRTTTMDVVWLQWAKKTRAACKIRCRVHLPMSMADSRTSPFVSSELKQVLDGVIIKLLSVRLYLIRTASLKCSSLV